MRRSVPGVLSNRPSLRDCRRRLAPGRLPLQLQARSHSSAAGGSVFLAEVVDAAGRIDNLLLAGIERVAVRTHFDLQIVSERRAGLERVAARAADRSLFVFGMACGFHGVTAGLNGC